MHRGWTGEVGLYTLQAILGTHPAVPYPNQQQSPNYRPAAPTITSALFEVTEGSYCCGFNSQGEVTSPGGSTTPDANAPYLRLPVLNHIDRPGKGLPAFTLSCDVRAE